LGPCESELPWERGEKIVGAMWLRQNVSRPLGYLECGKGGTVSYVKISSSLLIGSLTAISWFINGSPAIPREVE